MCQKTIETKMVRKDRSRKSKSKTGKPKNQKEITDAPNRTKQNICSAKAAECRNCKRKGNYEKMCRSLKKVKHVERTTSSAEDNWDYYEEIQNIDNEKHEKGFYQAPFLIKNVHIKFIIDSDSSVTLILGRLFNERTKLKPLETIHKDVNNQKIDFTGQTKAIVKANKETFELPLVLR